MTDTGEQNIIPDLEPTNSSVSAEPTDNVSKILKYKEEGYYFHGSANSEIEILEPRPSEEHDMGNDEFSKDNAVFGSPNPQACIFSLMNLDEVPEEEKTGTTFTVLEDKNGNLVSKLPRKFEKYIRKNIGTLYILPSATFIDGEEIKNRWQSKSLESVTPIDKISVNIDDFIALGGEVIWKEN